ncbi:multiheme c-type cytochrome [Hydrogenimonas sp.]
MRPLFAVFLALPLLAGQFVSSKVCSKCHPAIYKEYMGSMHRDSSVVNDPIHAAVWAKHPLKAKAKYNCAVCHAPSDTPLITALKEGKSALPQPNEVEKNEPIGCATCHRIRSIRHHARQNRNIYVDKPKYYYAAKGGKTVNETVKFHETSGWFGLSRATKGSPFHTIDYTNELFSSGYVCLGCHDHKRNKHDFAICDMGRKEKGIDTKRNCITCHMPQVKGSLSTITQTETHAFHGFAGVHVRPDLLARYVKLDAVREDDKLKVSLENEADHTLFSHPLRLGQLRVTIERGDREIALEPVDFFTKLGHDGRTAMPWVATQILAQNRIEAHQKRDFLFDFTPKKGDRIVVTLGYYIVNPKAARKLGIDDEALTSFKPLVSKAVRF